MDEWMGVDFKLFAGDLVVDGTGDASTASGQDCLAQDLAGRLSTPRGSVVWARGFGSSARQFLRSEGSEIMQHALRQMVASELEEDPRVIPGSAVVTVQSWAADAISLECQVSPVGKTNPLILVVTVRA